MVPANSSKLPLSEHLSPSWQSHINILRRHFRLSPPRQMLESHALNIVNRSYLHCCQLMNIRHNSSFGFILALLGGLLLFLQVMLLLHCGSNIWQWQFGENMHYWRRQILKPLIIIFPIKVTRYYIQLYYARQPFSLRMCFFRGWSATINPKLQYDTMTYGVMWAQTMSIPPYIYWRGGQETKLSFSSPMVIWEIHPNNCAYPSL